MNKEKIVIGLAGKLACGKGTISDYLIKNYGAIMHRFSDSLREVLSIYDLSISRDNMQNLSTVLRQHFSEDILAKAMVKKAREAKNDIIVIDGVRRFTDVKNFFKLRNFYFIFIETDQNKRYQRYIKRNENTGDAEMTFQDFQKKDSAESESQIDSLKDKAHFIIDNNGTFEELYQQVDKVLNDTNINTKKHEQ